MHSVSVQQSETSTTNAKIEANEIGVDDMIAIAPREGARGEALHKVDTTDFRPARFPKLNVQSSVGINVIRSAKLGGSDSVKQTEWQIDQGVFVKDPYL